MNPMLRYSHVPAHAQVPARRPWCLRCWLTNPVVMRRSLRVALVVGTVLAALNQGDVLLAGPPWPPLLLPKLLLTYCVPFAVATYGALANGASCPHARPR